MAVCQGLDTDSAGNSNSHPLNLSLWENFHNVAKFSSKSKTENPLLFRNLREKKLKFWAFIISSVPNL